MLPQLRGVRKQEMHKTHIWMQTNRLLALQAILRMAVMAAPHASNMHESRAL
jgi:hypothetical protein